MRIILSILLLSVCYSTVINVPEDYSTIQDGIDASSTGDTVLISSDIYYESIDFLSKNITVAGKYINSGVPADIMQTVIYNVSTLPTVTFGDAGQNNDASLIGISIYSENTGIQLNSTNATLERCLLYNPLHGSGILCNSSSPNIINCTIAGFDNAIFSDGNSNPDINSSILWSESSGIVGSGSVKYSCIRDGFNCSFTDLGGNIYLDPLFDIPWGSPLFGVTGPGLNWRNREYPWILYPLGPYDGKDNNPWNNANESSLIYGINNDGNEVRIGNGEAMDTGDPDGDGVMGEDWYNGYDDDGDGLVDEDYFYADGIDNGGIPCTEDSNEDGCFCCTGDYGVDENIDGIYDLRFDGVDNDKNGTIDDDDEFYWGANIDNNILIHDGRRNPLLPNGDANPYYIENNPSNNWDVMGDYKYDEELDSLFFDVYIYDFGDDGLPGDPFIDKPGDGEFQLGEPLYLGMFNAFLSDCGLDGICEYLTMPYDLDNDGYFDFGELNPDWPGPDADGTEGDGIWQPGDGWIDSNGNGQVDNPVNWIGDSYIETTQDNYNDVWPPKNGIWDEGEEINDWGHDGIPNTNDSGEGDGERAMDGFMGDPFTDLNGNGIYNYGETYSDLNNNGSYDLPTGEFDGIFDTGDGLFGFEGESFSDSNSNSIWDNGEDFQDENGDGQYTPPDYVKNWVNMPSSGIIGFTYGASDGFDNDGDGVIDNYEENGLFSMTAFRYLFLLESSPAIDAGDPGLSNDIDGSITDIGALTEHFIYGCTNPACDYDWNANVDDGSCECGVSREYADGIDNDGDWEEWAEEFGWIDDKDGDCPDGAGTIDSCWADPGEWGIVMLEAGVRNGVAYDAGQIFYPYEILYQQNGYPAFKVENFPDLDAGKYLAVGVDEFHSTSGISIWPVTDISIEVGEYKDMESFTDNNENGTWDDAYWTASSGTMPEEVFTDSDGDGVWDRGGYDVIISWEEPPYVQPGFYSEDGNTYYKMGTLNNPDYDIRTYDVFGYTDEMFSENFAIETSMLVESNIGSNQYICYYIYSQGFDNQGFLNEEFVNNETCIVTPEITPESDDDGICDDVDDCVIEDGASQECGCNTGIAEGACDCDGNLNNCTLCPITINSDGYGDCNQVLGYALTGNICEMIIGCGVGNDEEWFFDTYDECNAGCQNCKILDADGYGSCEMVLGWGWTGEACVQISGCGAGDDEPWFYDDEEICNGRCSYDYHLKYYL